MIEEVPSIRLEVIQRPDPALVAAISGTPTRLSKCFGDRSSMSIFTSTPATRSLNSELG